MVNIQSQVEEDEKKILEKNYQTQCEGDFTKKSAWVNFMLWMNRTLDSQQIQELLKGLPYRVYQRVLEIKIPPSNLEVKLQRLSQSTFSDFSEYYKKPAAEVIYTGLRKPLVDGEAVPCIPREESRKLGKVIASRGFDVLAYDSKRNATIILYASPRIINHIEAGISNAESDLERLKEYLRDFAEE